MQLSKISLNDPKVHILILAFFSAFTSYLVVYGFELTHFTLSIDEEPFDNFFQTLSAGRWGHALLRHYILPEPYLPFFTLLLSLIFLSCSAALASIYLKLNKIHAVAFTVMLAALPQMAYQFEFSNQSDTISLSILLSTASLFMLEKVSAWRLLIFVILTIVSLSVYQSVFLYSASLLCISLTLKSINEKLTYTDAAKKIVLFGVMAGIALIINSILSKMVAGHYGVQISGYLSAMIGWGKHGTYDVIKSVAHFIRDYIRFRAAYGMNSFAFCLIWIVTICVAVVRKKSNVSLTIILSVATFLSMFLLNIAIGSGMPPRAMTQASVVFAGLFICAISITQLKTSSVLIALVFLGVGASSSTRLFYSDYMAREADRNLSEQIINTIYNKYPQFDATKTPIFFYGSYSPLNSWRVPGADVFGASFYEWDGGNNQRMYKYLYTSNMLNVKIPDADQVERSRVNGKSMPSWPDRNAVRMMDGVVIVKLSDQLSDYNR
ncbi:Glucosyl transferase II [Pantoea sp. AS-PWVM4]|uniref:glucosyltransferase domain-containing protein n=1 Tax=Pantoea sp. AS-PWVM4 TaxID=1332069 RepID=UPI0003AC71D5|nr:glucosyltransferase domain-containing protein [Pantoea sp. AS-PWVM4]ERK07411.1 Glucosyl transferase II [Pantoea sp. AS-PWVM4]